MQPNEEKIHTIISTIIIVLQMASRTGSTRAQCHQAPCRRLRRQLVCAAALKTPCLDLKRVQLGKSELTVTEVCLGTMTFGEQTDEAEAHRQLSYAADVGVRFLDTAEIYPVAPRPETSGSTSSYIGRWFAKGGGQRSDWVIASKVSGRSSGLDWVPAGRTSPPGPAQNPRLDKQSIRQAVHGELRRLQTDWIDLLQLHWPERAVPLFGRVQFHPDMVQSHQQQSGNGAALASFEEQVEVVGELIKEGKVRAWGLSNETTYGLVNQCRVADHMGVPRPVTVQNSYSLVHRAAESELAEAMYYLGVGLLPWSALAGGAVTGKYIGRDAPPGSRFQLFAERYARFNTPRVQTAVAKYVELAREVGLTPAQLGLAFCRSKWFIPSTIVGARSCDQLAENLDAWRLTGQQGLDPEVLRRIDDIHVLHRSPALMD